MEIMNEDSASAKPLTQFGKSPPAGIGYSNLFIEYN
jgi:hypothetical protein